METKEQLLNKVAELQAIINKMDSDEKAKKFLLDKINGSVQSWEEGTDEIYWKKDGHYLMCYNRETKIFYIDYIIIWSVLETKFKLNNKQISELCSSILGTHFNCEVITTLHTSLIDWELFGTYFNY